MSGSSRDAQRHFADFLAALGVGDDDPEMVETPRRVAALYKHLFSGLTEAPPDLGGFVDPNADGSPVYIRAMPFISMCAHHLVPFFGVMDIAYIPGEVVGGVGAFPKVVNHFSLRPQVQERLVREVADYIDEALKPRGLIVQARARQMCMEMQPEGGCGTLACSAAKGCLQMGEPERQEVLLVLQRQSVNPGAVDLLFDV